MSGRWLKRTGWMLAAALGIGSSSGAQGWNMLDTHPKANATEVVATFDLKGSPCVIDLKARARACKQKSAAAPFLVKLTRSRQTYPDGARYDTLFLVPAAGSQQVVWTADEYKTAPSGSGFQIVSLQLKSGADGWLEIHTVEHTLPAKGDASFQPGPPLANRYVYTEGTYVLKR